MSIVDFTENFRGIDICFLSPDFLDSSSKCRWTSTCYYGSWDAGTTAGGHPSNKAYHKKQTFATEKMPPPLVNKKPRIESTTKNNTGTLDDPLKFLDQDYQELQKSCITSKKIFVDDKFPPDSSSIDPNKKLELDLGQIEWLRPSKLVADPQLIVQGVSRFDYSQGSYLGNCWFLASVGALTFQKDIMDQVMPADQSFGKDYAGIFHFRFWRFGKWIDVVIDDRLPTIKGELVFVLSKTSNEFWPALLEKAYAKVCGSYADMHTGFVSEALVDFTGGVHVCFELEKTAIDLWSLMDRAVKKKALMACDTHQGEKSENVLPNGIVQGHAYTVTGVFKVSTIRFHSFQYNPGF
ncbi:hypothetical protein cypCar_00040584 [Cyprinus carpio]|nr:hypothetical protein cypCar_00040584 [Cyprinus carpio]